MCANLPTLSSDGRQILGTLESTTATYLSQRIQVFNRLFCHCSTKEEKNPGLSKYLRRVIYLFLFCFQHEFEVSCFRGKFDARVICNNCSTHVAPRVRTFGLPRTVSFIDTHHLKAITLNRTCVTSGVRIAGVVVGDQIKRWQKYPQLIGKPRILPETSPRRSCLRFFEIFDAPQIRSNSFL